MRRQLHAPIVGALLLLMIGNALAHAPDTAGPPDMEVAMPSAFAPADGAKTVVASGEVARRGEILRVPVRYRRVGFLENDILRTGLVNSDQVVVPRGTAVFAVQFGSIFRNGRTMTGYGYRSAWCAVVERPEPRGYCMLRSFGRNETLIGYMPQSGSPYAPRLSEGFLPNPATAAQIREDRAADSRFPAMEMVISLEKVGKKNIELTHALQVGAETTKLRTGRFDLDAKGGVTLAVGDETYRLKPVGDALIVEHVAK